MGRVPEVELLHWPADADRREELAARRLPRLLLIAEGVAPPRLDPEEDWIRVPAPERDLRARRQRLARRFAGAATPATPPTPPDRCARRGDAASDAGG